MRNNLRVNKQLIDPSRVRRIPAGPIGFSWVDRRFVRDWMERLEHDEILLYLFLAAVADKVGLSFYSDERIAFTLKIGISALRNARAQLVSRGLIAHESPLYQVLALPDPAERRTGGLVSLAEILRELAAPQGRATP